MLSWNRSSLCFIIFSNLFFIVVLFGSDASYGFFLDLLKEEASIF